MSRRFDGTDDEVRVAVGACNITGAITVMAVCRKNVDGAWQALVTGEHSTGGPRWALAFNPSNQITLSRDSPGLAGANSTTTVTTADGWVIVAFTKASGIDPRFHIYKGGTWTHENGSAQANAEQNPNAAIDTAVAFGEYNNGDDFNGWLATCGVDNADYADAAVEAWASTQDLFDDGFAGIWDFNQSSTATSVLDLSSGGAADQTALQGTSVDSGTDPSFWTYGVGGGGAAPTVKKLSALGVG